MRTQLQKAETVEAVSDGLRKLYKKTTGTLEMHTTVAFARA